MPTPFSYPAEADAGEVSVARIGWRDFFPDPQLQVLIGTALEHNRDVRIAAGRVQEARAALRLQGGALLPQLDAVGTGTRGRTPGDLSITGQALVSSQYQAALSAGWEIDFWGRLRNLHEAALEQYLATEEARRAVATSLVTQVAASYLQALEFDERIDVARRTIATREETLRILRRRYEVGSGSRLDMTQAQTLLAQAQVALHALEEARAVNLNALALLVGKPVEIGPSSLGDMEMRMRTALPTGLPSELLTLRPDVVAAEHQLKAANANIGAARAAFLPNVQITGAFGTASSQFDGLFADGSRAWTFTPTIVLPLFHGGRNRANLDLAEARRNIAVANYERTIQAAFRDVADALAHRKGLAAQMASTRDMLAALQERARLANIRFENGRSAYLEVLDAQRDLFETEQALVQLRRAYLASMVSLYTALGGGFADGAGRDASARAQGQEEK